MSKPLGLLFYTAPDAKRNQWFIQQLCDRAESEGLSLRLCITDEGFPADVRPCFALNRSRIAAVSEYCEGTLRIPVFNSTQVTAVTNDKYRTHCFLRTHGLPTADTVLIRQDADAADLIPPLIAKPADGHGGAGVALLSDPNALKQAMQTMQRPFLLQKLMQTGWDLRVYVLGGQIYASVLRTSERDFRSNFSLGGAAQLYQPDAQIRQLVQQVLEILPLDFAGIDFLRSPDGGYVIGEIEDAVGCRMLYALTDLDPAGDLIRMIADRLSARK